jgi:adenosylcobinamide kinase / adenosylcobinamide-phosphate guanylyltransferase
MPLTLLLGGARSGKSTLATSLAMRSRGPVTFIATAEARDDEMAARIARHRDQRPEGWLTVEEPLELAAAVSSLASDTFAVVDCLTLWVSNALERGRDDDAIVAEARTVAEALAARDAPSVVISNEVGLGIVPANELARRYRDALGRVNTVVAGCAERALLVVAGRTLALEPAERT